MSTIGNRKKRGPSILQRLEKQQKQRNKVDVDIDLIEDKDDKDVIIQPSIEEKINKFEPTFSFNQLIDKATNDEGLTVDDINKTIKSDIINVDDNVTAQDVRDSVDSIIENDTIENIPDIVDVNDIELNITKRKNKRSFVKTKVTLKTNQQENSINLSSLFTQIKKLSGGVIKHRVCDLRSVGNTNKIQLKSSEIKLFKNSYTVKPTGGVVNKSTRIMLSYDPNEINYLIVYLQKSRDKYITKFELKDSEDWDYLAKWIYGFYETLNFNLFKYRLINRQFSDEPIFKTIKNIAKTKDFIVTLPKNPENLNSFKFKPIGEKNQHLNINVVLDRKTIFSPQKYYKVIVTSDIDKKLYLPIDAQDSMGNNIKYSLETLESENFLYKINNFVEHFNNDDYDIEDINFAKLRKRASQQALVRLMEIDTVEIIKVLNSEETKKELIKNNKNPKDDYDAENIVFKTPKTDYCILQYLAVSTGKDKRGYKNRPYMFKLIWSIGDKNQPVVITKNIDVIIDKIK